MSDRFPEVHLVAYLVPKPGSEKALADAMVALVPKVLKEPGCLKYSAHVSHTMPGTIVMVETWQDQAALDAHAVGPNLTDFAAQSGKLLAEAPRLEPLTRIA